MSKLHFQSVPRQTRADIRFFQTYLNEGTSTAPMLLHGISDGYIDALLSAQIEESLRQRLLGERDRRNAGDHSRLLRAFSRLRIALLR